MEKIIAGQRKSFPSKLKNQNLTPYKWLQLIITFSLILISWTFFRANTIHDAFLILYKELFLIPDLLNSFFYSNPISGIINISRKELIISIILILGLLVVEYLIAKKPFQGYYLPAKKWIRWVIYYFIIILIVLIGVFEKRDFIYFQF